MKQQGIKILIFAGLFLLTSSYSYLPGISQAAEPMSTQEMEATLVDNTQTRTMGWWETWQNKMKKTEDLSPLPSANIQLQNRYESWTEQTTYQRSMEQINDLSRENRMTIINRPINTVQPK